MQGEVLYSSLRYYWGPLGPYVNAALYWCFGTSSQVLAGAGIATAGVMCWTLFRLARRFVGPWRSASVALTFVFLCAFVQMIPDAIFNFSLPFNCSATYGVTLATVSVTLLIVHAGSLGRWAFVGSLVTLALAALTKMEVLFAIGVAHVVFLLLYRQRVQPLHIIGYGCVAASVAAIYGGFYLSIGNALWLDNLGALFNASSRLYVRETMGLASVRESLANVAASLAALAFVSGLAWALGRLALRTSMHPRRLAVATVALGLATFMVFAWLPVPVVFAALPLLEIGALGALALARPLFGDGPTPDWRAHVVLWSFALGLLCRIPLRASPMHYGFFLLPPSLVCLAILLYDYAPRRAGPGTAFRQAFAAVGAGVLLGSTFTPISTSATYFANFNVVRLATPTTSLLLPTGSPELTVVPILSRYPSTTRVAAIPEGIGLVFASGLQSADGMSSYLPMELPDEVAEERLLSDWRERPPDLIVWWSRDEGNFGYKGFGFDYGVTVAEWISAHYAPVSDPSLYMFVLQRVR